LRDELRRRVLEFMRARREARPEELSALVKDGHEVMMLADIMAELRAAGVVQEIFDVRGRRYRLRRAFNSLAEVRAGQVA
jgi:hypothetical protein